MLTNNTVEITSFESFQSDLISFNFSAEVASYLSSVTSALEQTSTMLRHIDHKLDEAIQVTRERHLYYPAQVALEDVIEQSFTQREEATDEFTQRRALKLGRPVAPR